MEPIVDQRGDRVGRNESFFREVNENIDTLATGARFEIVCECADRDCMKLITVERDVYEAVRRVPHRFIVFPEHVAAGLESVVGTGAAYWIVEKRGEAAEVAVQLDPRH
jgi:hypothetical protein